MYGLNNISMCYHVKVIQHILGVLQLMSKILTSTNLFGYEKLVQKVIARNAGGGALIVKYGSSRALHHGAGGAQ